MILYGAEPLKMGKKSVIGGVPETGAPRRSVKAEVFHPSSGAGSMAQAWRVIV